MLMLRQDNIQLPWRPPESSSYDTGVFAFSCSGWLLPSPPRSNSAITYLRLVKHAAVSHGEENHLTVDLIASG